MRSRADHYCGALRAANTSRRRYSNAMAIAFCLLSILPASGCGLSQGAALYMMGFGQRAIVKAKFELSDGPILILVDDPAGQIDWPPALKHLTHELGQELIKNAATRKVIPNDTLNHLRQTRPQFESLSCREIGELAGADQVLWVEVRRFFADVEFYEPSSAAWFAVSVKVINPLEKEKRIRVRLWPTSPRGQYVSVSLNGNAVAKAKTKEGISRALAKELAVSVTRFFYDYRPGDFER